MNQKHIPQHHQFPIGVVVGLTPADPTLVAILKRTQRADVKDVGTEEQSDPIFGLIENQGKDAFTFSLKQSNNNNYSFPSGTEDVYAAVNIRVGGASVASVVVQPGAQVAFSVELATKQFLRFNATQPGFGRLTLSHYLGNLERREREGVA